MELPRVLDELCDFLFLEESDFLILEALKYPTATFFV